MAASIVDMGGRITAVNQDWLGATGLKPGESYLRLCEIAGGGRSEIGAELGAGIRSVLSGGARKFEYDVPPKAGETSPAMRVSAVVFPLDAAARALLLYRPSGSPAPAEAELERQSEKMETVGRLVGGVAHDFANLLTLVAGYTELLLARTDTADPARGQLDEIRKAASRGSRLTAQLLAYSRTQPAEPEAIDLNALITGLELLLRPIIGEYVRLEMRLYPDLRMIFADSMQIEQVLMNLVLNARDAISQSGLIVIETANRSAAGAEARLHGLEPGDYVEVTVTDNGHGMSPETLARVFDPFFTTKHNGNGAGIGLSTVRRIAGEYRGAVWARSRPGQETMFTVWLPGAAAAVVPPAGPETIAAAASGGGECILLAEDEENVRRLLTHILERRGYRVVAAESAEEALRLFDNGAHEIDLLLTDMVMPGMSGCELGDRITRTSPEIPIVYMSGYTDDVLLRTGALQPGMPFLSKPLRPDVLAAKIREALDRARQRR